MSKLIISKVDNLEIVCLLLFSFVCLLLLSFDQISSPRIFLIVCSIQTLVQLMVKRIMRMYIWNVNVKKLYIFGSCSEKKSYPARRIGCIILINYTRQCFAKLIDRWGIMLVASTWVTLYVYIFIHGRLYMSGSVRPSGRCSVDPLVRSHFQSVNFSNGWWLWLKSTRLFTCVIALSHSPTGNLIHHISLKLTSDNKSSIGGPQFARRINLWVNIEIYLSLSLSLFCCKNLTVMTQE